MSYRPASSGEEVDEVHSKPFEKVYVAEDMSLKDSLAVSGFSEKPTS